MCGYHDIRSHDIRMLSKSPRKLMQRPHIMTISVGMDVNHLVEINSYHDHVGTLPPILET